jgi:Flp pilus assembly protein TadG
MKTLRSLEERGAIAPLVAVMLLGLLAMMALVIDGGLLFAERRDLQAAADGAARAGAMAIDQDLLRETGAVRLDPAAARTAAERYLEAAGVEGTIRIDANMLNVSVDLEDERPTLMMGLLGLRTVDVIAHAVARPRVGIEEAGG